MSEMCLYALHSDQLFAWLRETVAIFGGVFCRDRLPLNKVHSQPTLYIVNTAQQKHPTGIHWVAMLVGIATPEYFDSLGRPPHSDLLDLLGTRYIHNKVRVQSPLYPTCGYYCLFFAVCRSRGTPMNVIVEEMRSSDDCTIASVVQQIHPLTIA